MVALPVMINLIKVATKSATKRLATSLGPVLTPLQLFFASNVEERHIWYGGCHTKVSDHLGAVSWLTPQSLVSFEPGPAFLAQVRKVKVHFCSCLPSRPS